MLKPRTSFVASMAKKILKYLSPIKLLSWTLAIIATIGISLSIITFIGNGINYDIFLRPICLTKNCANDFIEQFMPSFVIAKGTMDFLVAIATTGGIVVALLSYLTASGTAALTNHISHFSVFQNYVIAEVSKRTRVDLASIDTLVLYNCIFSESRSGRTDISNNYINFVKELNSLIEKSNTQAERAIEGAFRYKQHQERIRDQLQKCGIVVFLSPRNDFYEMEGQLFSLIDRVNQSFCYSNSVPALIHRKYI